MSGSDEQRRGIVVPFGQRAAAPGDEPTVEAEPTVENESPANADAEPTADAPEPVAPAPSAEPEPIGDPAEVEPVRAAEIARSVEALLFLSSDPVKAPQLADACECEPHELVAALDVLRAEMVPERRGLILREVAGGYTLATSAEAEPAARRLLAKPRTPPLSPAQAETLAIVAYLQPASRPEITRIRGVSADSASQTLLERGLIEEAGRSQFGAVLYRTTPLFLKLFGLRSLKDLPPVTEWDPSPDEEADLRERLLRAGEARAGTTAVAQPDEDAGSSTVPGLEPEPSPAA
ncbi:SMC-Scp complex subunit ScpB [Paraconexibacter sp.]|uniref:SMC-Scp complex subunit ScpB n=1 Tax=Paraconexibacter sp. TaxID=2949640 RepID=UPI0035687EE2